MITFPHLPGRSGINLASAFLLLTVIVLPCRAAGMAPVEIKTPFAIGPMKPDPTRNVVYLVDATYNRILAFDTDNGQQVAGATVDDGSTQGDIAISVDDNTLYLAESSEDEILTYSLPDLTPTGTITTGFPPYSIAAGAGGRLYASESGMYSEGLIAEVSTTDGSTLQTFGSSENYYYDPVLRTNAAGTHLYATSAGLSGFGDVYVYDITGAHASSATGYQYDMENLEDFEPDEANGRIYLENGGIYGVNVLITATDNYQTVWPFTGAYGVAVSYNASSSVVFGASGDPYEGDIKEFNRSNGAPLADWVVAKDTNSIPTGGIAATANNFVLYTRSPIGSGEATPTFLGLISTTGLGVTLVPTLTDTLSFNPNLTGGPGQQVTLQASDLSGLPITFQVVSGPATIHANILTFTGEGTVVVEAVTAGNLIYKVTTSSQSITVARQPQTISPFAVISDKVYHTPSFTIAKPTATSGLPVAITVQSGPATLNGNLLTVIGVGAVTLAANQSGNAAYSPAPQVTTSFNVTPASQTIAAFAAIPAKPANSKPFAVTPPAATSGLPVTLSVQSGPATISGNVVTVTGTGTVTLAANQAGNGNYLAASTVTTNFTVTGVAQTIAAFKAVGAKTYTTVPFAITPPVATSKLPVTVTVLSGPATIAGNNVTITGTGTVILAANQAGNAVYGAAPQVTTSFVVSPAKQPLTAFATIPTQVYGEAPFAVTPPVATSGLPVSVFVVSGPATVSSNTVTITGVGTIKLGAAQAGDADYLAATQVTTTFMAKEGQTIAPFATIPAQVYGEAAFAITPPTSSSNLPVTVKVLSGPATILANKVTLTGAGTVTLAANQAGNATFAPAAQVTTSFSVSQKAQTIAAFKVIPAKTYGVAPFVVAAPAATSKLAVTLSVLAGPATIAGTKVTITGTGTVTLGADQAGNVNYLPAPEVTTSFVVNPAAQTISHFALIPAKTTTSAPFTITLPTATSKLPVTVTVLSGPAMISGNTITLTGTAGTVVLAANQAGNANYNAAAQVTTSFVVK